MRSFDYISPASLDEAIDLIAENRDARILAGGTDLLAEMKRGVIQPARLVNLKALKSLSGIQRGPDGALTIGALTTLSDITAHAGIEQAYPLLVQAIQRTASPQIRNVATLGGNLCQRPRCWYYRHPDFPCMRKHGEGCFAMGGQDRYHAIFGGYRCFIVHPSDPAIALVALDAQAEIAGPEGVRSLPIADFFVGPEENMTRETALEPGQMLTSIHLPPPQPGTSAFFWKVSERRATDFALASIALHLRQEEEQIQDARVVLGGVAPVPWRLESVEATLLGKRITEESIQEACQVATRGAKRLQNNGYKLGLVQGLLRKALTTLQNEG